MFLLFEIKNNSLYIPSANLYIDSLKKKEFGFISHAHIDHIARHKKILCSKITAEFIKLRLKNPDCLIIPFNKDKKINQKEIFQSS